MCSGVKGLTQTKQSFSQGTFTEWVWTNLVGCASTFTGRRRHGTASLSSSNSSSGWLERWASTVGGAKAAQLSTFHLVTGLQPFHYSLPSGIESPNFECKSVPNNRLHSESVVLNDCCYLSHIVQLFSPIVWVGNSWWFQSCLHFFPILQGSAFQTVFNKGALAKVTSK